MTLTLLSPVALVGMTVPIAIYLIHWLFGTRRRVRVPAVFLWADLPQAASGRRRRRMPPFSWLLLLQLLAASVLAVALARPSVPSDPPRHVAVILDASGSMQATDVAPSRFEVARRSALERIRKLRPSDLVSVIQAGKTASLIAAGAPDRVSGSVQQAQPGRSAPAIRESLALASTRISATPERPGQILLFTDVAWSAPDPVGPLAAPVEVVPTGGGSNNQAINSVVIRMDPTGRGQIAFIKLSNASAQAVSVPLQISADGSPLDQRQVDMAARSRTDLSIPLPADAHNVTVQLQGHDALALDDKVEVIAPGGPPRDVDLVGRVSEPLRRAIESVPSLHVRTAKDATSADLTVLVGVLPAQLPPGPLLLVDPPANSARLSGVGVGSGARLQPDHPLLQGLDLVALRDQTPTVNGVPGWANVVLGTERGPLIMQGRLEGHPVVSLTFDAGMSGLDKSLAFPLLVSNATQFLFSEAGATKTIESFDTTESDITPRSIPSFEPVIPQTDPRSTTSDIWPWLAGCGLGLLVLEWLIFARRTPHPFRIGFIAARVAVTSLVVVALIQPSLRPTGHGRSVVFAVDVSDSLTADQISWAQQWVQRAIAALPAGSQSSVIEFGTRAQLAGAARRLPSESTDLAATIRLAGSLVSHDAALAPEVVLLTDGWATAGPSAIDALPGGVAISYVALPPPVEGQRAPAVIHRLTVPDTAREGDRIDVQLDLQAVQPVDARLRLTVNEAVVGDGPLHLEAGDTHLNLPIPVPGQGFVEVRATLRTGDLTSTLASVVLAKPAGHILLLEDPPYQADNLASLLSAQGLQIERQPVSSLPPSAGNLRQFDGIVLINTPATSLTLDQQRTLQSFVQDLGRGLVVIGGPEAYSPGGYQGTPLDDLMPVAADPPIDPQQGSLALFLVIDRSGSMDIVSGGSGGATKMAMAREAAIEAAGLLQPEDSLGIIAFDSTFQWVVPPTKLRGPDDIKRIQARISTIRAGGGTTILPPLQAAFEAAAASDAPLKHIILMTDGESNDKGYEELLARMAPAQITLSTLAIGSDADTRLLTTLAHLGGGRYYFTERGSQIPRIASKETSILTRNAVINGQVAAEVSDPSPILRSISGDLPELSGYVATTRKDHAITALETERGHPLLAHWQYGLGRVVAWTSEAQQGWASAWATWPDAGQFWSQAVRWALPAPVASNFQPSVRVGTAGREVHLSVRALSDEGRYADLEDTRATVVGPDGSARELRLRQQGPGEYATDTRVAVPGQYRVLFTQGTREEVAAFEAPDSIELHSVGTDIAVLDQLATASSGLALHAPTDLKPGHGQGPPMEFWPWLLVLALVLLPVDVLVRRRT